MKIYKNNKLYRDKHLVSPIKFIYRIAINNNRINRFCSSKVFSIRILSSRKIH